METTVNTTRPSSGRQLPITRKIINATIDRGDNRAGRLASSFTWSCLVCTLALCPIFGFVALIYSFSSRRSYNRSDYRSGNVFFVKSLESSLFGFLTFTISMLILLLIVCRFQPFLFANCGATSFPRDCVQCFDHYPILNCGIRWMETCCKLCRNGSPRDRAYLQFARFEAQDYLRHLNKVLGNVTDYSCNALAELTREIKEVAGAV